MSNLEKDIIPVSQITLRKLVDIIQLDPKQDIDILGIFVEYSNIFINVKKIDGIPANVKMFVNLSDSNDDNSKRIRLLGKLRTNTDFNNSYALEDSVNAINSRYNMNKYYIDSEERDKSTGNAFIISEYETYIHRYMSKPDFLYQIKKFVAVMLITHHNEDIFI